MKNILNLMALTIVMTLSGFNANAQGETEFYFSNPEMAKDFERFMEEDSIGRELSKTSVRVMTRNEDGIMYSLGLVNGRRLFEKNKKFGYVDSEGQIVITPQYDFGDDFKDGVAVVGKKNPAGSAVSYHKWHIDRNGKPLYATNLYCDVNRFVNGYAIVDVTGGYKMCHIDRSGKPLYPERYTYCYNFNTAGRALVQKTISSKDIVRFLVINTSGTVLGFKEYKASENRMNPDALNKVKTDLAKWLNP